MLYPWIPACAGMTALFMFCSASNAADYKPATVGYLYENCVTVLEKSASPQEFLSSYCGAFIEGYGTGIMAVNNIPLTEPDEKDPCAMVKAKEYGRVNARFCSSLPEYAAGNADPGVILQTAVDIAARWINFPKAKKQRAALMKKPAVKEINAIIKPGKFCDSLEKYGPQKDPLPIINPALLKANWYDLTKNGPSIADKISQCKADLAQKNFAETRCAAEITGFIAGLHATSHLQEHEPVKGACGKEIARLYDGLDILKSKCIGYDTNLADIAKIFVEKKSDWTQKTFAITLGASGYFPIYYGYMCRQKSEEKSE